MSDDSVKTICGTFGTRAAADLAVEHLVQEHGIDRADIFVEARDTKNTSGTAPSGGDASRAQEEEGTRFSAALDGPIQVSADVAQHEIAKAAQAFRSIGATDVLTR